MFSLSRILAVAVGVALAAALPAQDPPKPVAAAAEQPDDGFKPLFNGKNLDGWVNVNCHPDTFFVKGDEIITTGQPTGFLRAEKQYENFVLEFDWMHVEKEKMANSGLFVWGDPLPAVGTPYTRGIEVQVLINFAPKDGWATSHGDIFSIHGARCTPDRPHPTRKGLERCLPSENRVKGGGEWNHYKVTANDGAIKLEVNGKEVSGVSKCTPRKGYLALESEGAECHFKNIKIKELPSTNPKPEEVAKLAEGHVSIFNGLDLKGWTVGEDDKKENWKAAGGAIRCAGLKIDKAAARGLVTDKAYKDFEFVVDARTPTKAGVVAGFEVRVAKDQFIDIEISDSPAGPTTPREVVITVKNGDALENLEESDVREVVNGPGKWNRFVITRKGNKLTVTANGKALVTNEKMKTPLPTGEGKIVLTSHGEREFMNLFARELKPNN